MVLGLKLVHVYFPFVQKTRLFMKELTQVIPNSTAFHRRQSNVKKMIAQSVEKGFTDIVVINEHNKEPSKSLVLANSC